MFRFILAFIIFSASFGLFDFYCMETIYIKSKIYKR